MALAAVADKEKIVVVGYGWVGQANALALTQGTRFFIMTSRRRF